MFNIAGRLVPAIITFATVPIYLSYIGETQYAFVGVLVTMQSMFILLDGGFSAGYLRRVAEFTIKKNSKKRLSNLTLSVEILFILISAIIYILMYNSLGWMVESWLKTDFVFSFDALKLIFAIVSIRFLILPYYACLKGFSKFDWVNTINITSSVAKFILALVLLETYTSDVISILIAFLVISFSETFIIRLMVFKLVPYKDLSIQQGFVEILKIKRFIGGMALVSFLSALLSQLDKVVVSNILSLDSFSYYSIAALLATIPLIISTPIAGAIYPKLVQSVSIRTNELEYQYLFASKYISVLVFPICCMVLFNSDFILYFWTNSESVMSEGSGPLSILIVANTILAIMSMPYFISLAYGDTSIPIRTNLIALILSLPAFYILGGKYNTIGVSIVWLSINFIFLFVYLYMIKLNQYLSYECLLNWIFNINLKSLLISVIFSVLAKEIVAFTNDIAMQFLAIPLLFSINVFSCYRLVKLKSYL
ncbi:hypothetical protein ACWOVX_003349 [Vibrio vulnificus]